MSTTTHTTTERRQVARIVFDRPPLRKLQFVLWTLAGLALGFLVALLLHLLYYGFSNANLNIERVYWTNERAEWFLPLMVTCTLAGAAIGWGMNREVTARIEKVEQPPMQRTRSASTAMVRMDYGRRW